MQAVDRAYSIRPYEVGDERQVLELLTTSLGEGPAGGRTSEFFRWKHWDNPFGHSLMLVAESNGSIVGLRAFMRWTFESQDKEISAVRAVDTSTHPSFRRMGMFRRMTLDALDVLTNDTDLVFNTPNDKSRPGYLKMGWESVGRIPVAARVRRPLRVVRRRRAIHEAASGSTPAVDSPTAHETLSLEGIDVLLRHAERFPSRLATRRSLEFLQWRYGAAPGFDYRAVCDSSGERINGLAIFRVRPRGGLWETTISELILRPGETSIGRALLHRVVEAAPVDHLVCSLPPRSAAARAALLSRFVRIPGNATLVTNVLREPETLDPREMSSWALSLGDLEVF